MGKRNVGGFTLIELMVTVVIIGIIASIAYPAFTSFIQRSRRADAMAVLAAIVQAQERYRSNRAQYASSLTDLNKDVDVSKVAPNYTVELVAAADGFASGYEAKATVKTGSPQARDSECATMSVRFERAMLTYLATDKDGNDKRASCWPR